MDDPSTEDIRLMLAEDLATIGMALGEIRNGLTPEDIDNLLPRYKRDRFIKCLASARTEILRAMDMLLPKESPTTESIVADLIDRWGHLHEHERKKVIAQLREAFKK